MKCVVPVHVIVKIRDYIISILMPCGQSGEPFLGPLRYYRTSRIYMCTCTSKERKGIEGPILFRTFCLHFEPWLYKIQHSGE